MGDRFVVRPGRIAGLPLEHALSSGAQLLRRAGIETGMVDAQLLAGYLLGLEGDGPGEALSRGEVQRQVLLGRRLTPSQVEQYDKLLHRRAAREPLQHITGTAPFHRIELRVGPGVFIPRPETEVLVERALEVLGLVERPRVVDLCTGSGAIAAAVKAELPDADVFAVELSAQALVWARQNLDSYGVHLVHGDARTALEGMGGLFDAVLTNPPYIPDGCTPQDAEVTEYDPPEALYGGGADGMELPAAVAARAAYLLAPGGFFMMEHDSTQRRAVAEVLQQLGFTGITAVPDLAGRKRHTAAYKPLI